MHCIKLNNELLIYCAGYIITARDCGITSNLIGKTVHFIDHEPDIVNIAAAALQKKVTDDSAKTKSSWPTEA
jgi:hypothetical protein